MISIAGDTGRGLEGVGGQQEAYAPTFRQHLVGARQKAVDDFQVERRITDDGGGLHIEADRPEIANHHPPSGILPRLFGHRGVDLDSDRRNPVGKRRQKSARAARRLDDHITGIEIVKMTLDQVLGHPDRGWILPEAPDLIIWRFGHHTTLGSSLASCGAVIPPGIQLFLAVLTDAYSTSSSGR